MSEQNSSTRVAPVNSTAATPISVSADQAATRPDVTLLERAPQSVTVTGPERHGILATARQANGAIAFDLKPDTVVKVGDVAMRIARAVDEGFLVYEGPGNYREPTPEEIKAKADAAKEAKEQERAAREFRNVDPDAKTFLSDFAEGIQVVLGRDPDGFLMQTLVRPDLVAVDLEKVARAMGTDAEGLAEDLESVQEAYAGQISREILEPRGINPDAFRAHFDSLPAPVQARMMHRTVCFGDKAQWIALADDFASKRGNARTPSADELRTTAEGRDYIMVKGPGGTEMAVSLAVARKHGFIK